MGYTAIACIKTMTYQRRSEALDVRSSFPAALWGYANMMKSTALVALAAGLLVVAGWAQAGSRQLGTGGATQIEGSAGGGLVPWASIAGYGAMEEHGFTAFATFVNVDDYELTAAGVAWGWRNRVEVSLARQELDLITLGPALGLAGATLEQDIFGLKLRLAGDLIYTAIPQISAGIQYKRNNDFLIPSVAGAEDDDGFDLYLSATKLFLAGVGGFNGFANGTVRFTEANELGLLGFGGDRRSSHSAHFEGTFGLFLNKRTAIGVEYRDKPSNLSFAPEDDWWDAFIAWFPNRHVSVVGAYVDLGEIATLPDQTGYYISVEGSF